MYFKPGTLLEGQFAEEERARERTAFRRKSAKQPRAQQSEADAAPHAVYAVQVGAGLPEESRPQAEEQPMPRRISDEEEKNVKSLNRHGERNLYLLVKGTSKGKYDWRFPTGAVESGELLHEVRLALLAILSWYLTFLLQAAQRDLNSECGRELNTWVVGRRPVGFFEYQNADSDAVAGEKVGLSWFCRTL